MRFRLFLLTALFLRSAAAQATTVLPLDLLGLTDGAEQIVVGRVEHQVARFTADHGSIFTEVTFRVESSLKGDLRAGAVVLIRREGGEAEGMGVKVVGAPRFVVGEQAVVFLESRGTDGYWTVGMAQGKLRITSGAGQPMVVHDYAGLAFTAEPPSEPRVQPLEDVLARIRDRVARSPRTLAPAVAPRATSPGESGRASPDAQVPSKGGSR